MPLIYALQRTEPKRVAAVVVRMVVRDDIIVRALPEFEGNALVLEELGERLAVLRPDDVVDLRAAAAGHLHGVGGLQFKRHVLFVCLRPRAGSRRGGGGALTS